MFDVHRKIHEEYGDLVYFPGSFGKPNMVLCYNPEYIERVYRNEGKWPYRSGLDSFDYFRKHMRPELFKGSAGLLTEYIRID